MTIIAEKQRIYEEKGEFKPVGTVFGVLELRHDTLIFDENTDVDEEVKDYIKKVENEVLSDNTGLLRSDMLLRELDREREPGGFIRTTVEITIF